MVANVQPAESVSGVRLSFNHEHDGDTLEQRTRRVLRHLTRTRDAFTAVDDMLDSDDYWDMAYRADDDDVLHEASNTATGLPWTLDTLNEWALLEVKRHRCPHRTYAVQPPMPGIRRGSLLVCHDCGKELSR